MKHLFTHATAGLVLAFLLTACGGGGGGEADGGVDGGADGITYSGVTTQAAMTVANANLFFSLMWNGGTSSGTISDSTGVAKAGLSEDSKAIKIVPVVKQLAKKVTTKRIALAAQSKITKSAVPINETYSGMVSGTLTITGSLDDTTGTGTVIETYDNFNDGDGDTYDGAVTFQINGYDMATGVITDSTLSFTLWTIKSAGSDVSLSGSMRMQASVENESEVMTVNIDGSDNISKETFRFANFVLSNVYDSLSFPTSAVETYSGRIYLEKYGYAEVITVSPCIYTDPDSDPSSGGPIILVGAGNSKASFTPLLKSYVKIEVDDNGDGDFENRGAYAWNNLTGESVNVLISITVTPDNPSIAKGTTQQFTAIGTFFDNNTQDLSASVVWSTSDTNRASINSSGLATGTNVDTVTITATFGDISGLTTLMVTPAVIVSIAISPSNQVIYKGTSQRFSATGTFSDQTVQDMTQSVVWSSSDSFVATITNAAGLYGQAFAISNGLTLITAVSGDISVSATLTVADWTLQPVSLGSYYLENVAWSGAQLVAVGTGNSIFTSPDGVEWNQRGSGLTTADLLGITWSGTQFIAVGGPSGVNNFAAILTSPDGITWSQHSSNIVTYLNGVACSSTLCVAAGGNGTILTSPDGVTWSLRESSAPNAQLAGVAWSGREFVVVGNGAIITSPDGIAWTRRADIPINLSSVIWSGTQFVSVGNGIFTSPDGITWTQRDANSAYGIAWSGTQYVAVGGNWYNSFILTSPDGVTWTSQSFDSTMILQGVVWGGTKFVAVGARGTVVTSP